MQRVGSGDDEVSPFSMVEETSVLKPFSEHEAWYLDGMAFLSIPVKIFWAVNATAHLVTIYLSYSGILLLLFYSAY